MIETIVKVFLRDKAGNLDSFTTTINLPEQESHAYYLGRSWNMGVEGDRMMECYKVETVEAGYTISECARKVNERLSYHFADTSGGWNVPKEMPLMQEFLNEVRTLCDLCFAAEPDDKTKNAQFSGRSYDNIVSSYFFYMWTFWEREECNLVFGRESEHFWQKWCHYAEPSAAGAAEKFYSALSVNNRRKLVDRACTVYDGDSLATTAPAPELLAKISSHLHTLTQIDQHNELSLIFMDEQKRHEIDMQPWIDEWHACECDFAAWYAGLPTDMQGKVIDYYRKQKSL